MSFRTIRSAFLRSSFSRARSTLSPASAAKATTVWLVGSGGGEAGEDVLGGLQVEVEGGVAGELAVCNVACLEVGGGGGHQEDLGARELGAGRLGELLGRLDVDAVDAGGLGEADVGGDQGHVCAAAGGGRGEGDAHAAAGAVAEEADGVDRLAGAARGDEDAEAVPGALAGGQLGFDAGQEAGRVGQAALAVLAARGEGALVGVDHGHAALAQGRQVGLGGGVGVHAVVHRRGDQARRRAGEERGGDHRVGLAGGELGDRVGRGRGDEVGVAVGGQLEVADRVVRGSGIAGEGAAHRVALELGEQHRGADDALEGGGADEAGRALGHQHANAMAGSRRQAREFKRLVGGDPSAYAEQDSGHGCSLVRLRRSALRSGTRI